MPYPLEVVQVDVAGTVIVEEVEDLIDAIACFPVAKLGSDGV